VENSKTQWSQIKDIKDKVEGLWEVGTKILGSDSEIPQDLKLTYLESYREVDTPELFLTGDREIHLRGVGI